MRYCRRLLCILTGTLFLNAIGEAQQFALHDGDRVVFYGDRITAQRLYTVYVQTAVHARYPEWNIRFYNAGVGGDKVTGGIAGPIDERLTRDVIARGPTVVTIMLGMNDRGSAESRSAYPAGYEHILKKLKEELPGVRITVLGPSPLDDITRPRPADGGNGDLLRFSELDHELARRYSATFIDLNAPVLDALRRVDAVNHLAALNAIPDRVHPEAAIHMLMAEAILRGWGFAEDTAIVSLNSKTGETRQEGSIVTGVSQKDHALSWTEDDAADEVPFNASDGSEALYRVLSRQPHMGRRTLQVTGLPQESYTLSIDGKPLPERFSAEQFDVGVDLSMMVTPMHAAGRAIYYACSDSEIDQVVRNRLLGRAPGTPAMEQLQEGRPFIEAGIDVAERRIADAHARKKHTFVLSK